VLVASGTPAVLPARDATNVIPIVIVAAIDPIATGVVTRTYLKIAEGCRSAISVE